MNEYTKQAEDFCKKWNVEIDIKAVDICPSPWDEKNDHIRYVVTITRGEKSFKIDFYGSINELEQVRLAAIKKIHPLKYKQYKEALQPHLRNKLFFKDTLDAVKQILPKEKLIGMINKNETINNLIIKEYDVLASIEKYFEGTIDNFISEFGYDGAKTRKEWRKIEDSYEETIRQANELNCLFPESEAMEELQEIN
jgi:hypothetical protein